jgi:hypothetical protein
MGVAQVGLVFVPPSTAHEVVGIDYFEFVHFVSAFSVEAESVEIDGTIAQHVFGAGRGIDEHGDVVDDLEIADLDCV